MTARVDPLKALSAIDDRGWLVGGALRDTLLGRPTSDLDVVVEGAAGPLARQLAKAIVGHVFKLSEGFGVWRVISRDRSWQLDLLPLAGRTIEADLAARDLTVNAIAQPLDGGQLVDPFGGFADLLERRLRMVSPEGFALDPLRTLRVVRLACELGFAIEPATAAAASAAADGLSTVAPERVFAEIKRIVCSDRAVDGLRLMDELKITEVVLPELTALHSVEQSPYHHLDVHEHTLAVLAEVIALEREPAALGRHADAVSAFLAQPLANELTRWQALRFGALLHDIAKPATRKVTESGRVTFVGHDSAGGEMARAVLGRLRASERLAEHVAGLARHHLQLGFLVHEMPLSRRAIYRYLHECSPVGIDVTVLTVADRLATRGVGSEEAIAKHLQLAEQLLGEGLRWVDHPPRPPIRGDELARALGLTPGPELGWLLAELQEASFAHEIESREEAVALARELLGSASQGGHASSARRGG
jgi:putative nucleotidyltransferase with HDIG domain